MFRIFTLLLISVALSSCGNGTAATAGGAEIHWESKGVGPALVFIYGAGRDMSDWTYQVAEFQEDYRVITLDLPGHGQSETPTQTGENSMSHFADAVEAVRAEAGVDQMVLIGHSLGGFVIGEYMMLYPQYVTGIVAADTAFHGPLGQENPETGIVFTATITREDSIESPGLLVLGENSPLRFQEIEQELRQSYPRAGIEVIPDVGHFVQTENPAEFNRLLRGFLEEIDF
jgi:pimeloyl-ACP methyl ester carboxylesterase